MLNKKQKNHHTILPLSYLLLAVPLVTGEIFFHSHHSVYREGLAEAGELAFLAVVCGLPNLIKLWTTCYR